MISTLLTNIEALRTVVNAVCDETDFKILRNSDIPPAVLSLFDVLDFKVKVDVNNPPDCIFKGFYCGDVLYTTFSEVINKHPEKLLCLEAVLKEHDNLSEVQLARTNLNEVFRHLPLKQATRNVFYKMLDNLTSYHNLDELPDQLPNGSFRVRYQGIVATDPLGTVGRSGSLPWTAMDLPDELAHFRKITGNNVVVMGKNTFQSLPMYPNGLPGRINIVLSKTLAEATMWLSRLPHVEHNLANIKKFGVDTDSSKVYTLTSKTELFFEMQSLAYKLQRDVDVFIIGGANLLDGFLRDNSLCRLHITLTHKFYPGDVCVPELPMIVSQALVQRGMYWETDPVECAEEHDSHTHYVVRRKLTHL